MKMECKKCGYIWKEKKVKPKTCPSCHRYTYDIPRRWDVKVKNIIENNPVPISNNPEQPVEDEQVAPSSSSAVNEKKEQEEKW